jgi:hypothetical protein
MALMVFKGIQAGITTVGLVIANDPPRNGNGQDEPNDLDQGPNIKSCVRLGKQDGISRWSHFPLTIS